MGFSPVNIGVMTGESAQQEIPGSPGSVTGRTTGLPDDSSFSTGWACAGCQWTERQIGQGGKSSFGVAFFQFFQVVRQGSGMV